MQVRNTSIASIYMRLLIIVSLFISNAYTSFGQEFFINAETASTLPKGTIMPQLYGSFYDETGVSRLMAFVGANFGVTSNLTIRAAVAGSNHHGQQLPRNIISHNHGGTTNNVLIFNPGIRYDFRITGVNLFAKYRLFSLDKKKDHLRGSVYGEFSTAESPHDESETNLVDDNKGYGFGFILTKLKNRLAVSTTVGFVQPYDYKEFSYGSEKHIDYGSSVKYSLSAGYLLYPKTYDNYQQINYNLYLELVGTSFQAVDFFEDAEKILLVDAAHGAGSYLEVHPGIQRIVNSNTILEFSAGFKLVGRSYSHTNPIFRISWRKILYL